MVNESKEVGEDDEEEERLDENDDDEDVGLDVQDIAEETPEDHQVPPDIATDLDVEAQLPASPMDAASHATNESLLSRVSTLSGTKTQT